MSRPPGPTRLSPPRTSNCPAALAVAATPAPNIEPSPPPNSSAPASSARQAKSSGAHGAACAVPMLPTPLRPASGPATNAPPPASATLKIAPRANCLAALPLVPACFGLAARSAGGTWVLLCWIVTGFPLHAAQMQKSRAGLISLLRTLAKAERKTQQISDFFQARQFPFKFPWQSAGAEPRCRYHSAHVGYV